MRGNSRRICFQLSKRGEEKIADKYFVIRWCWM